MNLRLAILFLTSLVYQSPVLAATTQTTISPTSSMLKMLLGLIAVLVVLVALSWLVKRMMPGAVSQNSAINVIGGVNVGSRERVVVLEIAGRWVVVGVAAGQVSAIANLEKGADDLGADELDTVMAKSDVADVAEIDSQLKSVNPLVQPLVKPFSAWLKKSTERAKNKLSNQS